MSLGNLERHEYGLAWHSTERLRLPYGTSRAKRALQYCICLQFLICTTSPLFDAPDLVISIM